MCVWDPNLSQQAEGESCPELRSHTPAAGSLHRPWELRTGGQGDKDEDSDQLSREFRR